ncbi:MAG TPA: prenyltransferase/squalene oxidase repeat-containing protein [Thermomicrobiales bacterium]|nr:prenyltransferase/squalene oxidase repeat-containing protein [Thermomicrobiales bacterium]
MTHPAARFLALPLLIWAAVLGIVRVTVAPAELCGPGSAESFRDTALDAAGWLKANQFDDGSYVYIYDRDEDALPDDYNIVRHAGVTMSLYQVAGRLGDAASFEAAERGTAYLIENMHYHDDWGGPVEGGNIKVGTAALMTIALAERRLLTGEDTYDDVMRALGRFLLAQQKEDGGFYTKWFVESESMDLVSTSAYYPGEALWALAMLHEAFPGEGWDAAAWKAADFVTLLRDDVENVPYPPLNDHWAAYGMAEMVEWGLADHHIDYARRLAGRFSLFIRFEAQKTDEGLNLLLRGDSRNASALGTWVEGMAALWRLAESDERMADLAGDIREQAACGADLLARRQAEDDRPPREAGAWFIHGRTRMDDQQHAISGLIYTADALDGRVKREPDVPGANTR